MDRRAFLRALGITATAAGAHALDLDKLLWVPGQKTIFLPPTVIHAERITMRFIRAFDPYAVQMVNRVDCMIGMVPPEFAGVFTDAPVHVEEYRTVEAPSLDRAVDFLSHSGLPSALRPELKEGIAIGLRKHLRPGALASLQWA